jgi:hypothetical protein
VSKLREGDACRDFNECPANQYCKDSKCARAVKEGGECSGTDPCSYGLSCVASDELFKKYVCANIGAFHEGDRFKFATSVPANLLKVKTPNADFYLVGLCKTQIAMVLDDGTLQWRRGAVSASQNLKHLKRKHHGDECKITVTDDPDPARYMRTNEATVQAKCGFNKDSYAYCNPQIGDNYVFNAMEAARNKLTIPNERCHVLSISDETGAPMCAHAYEEYKDKAILVVIQRISSAIPQTYNLNTPQLSKELALENDEEENIPIQCSVELRSPKSLPLSFHAK